MTTTATTYELRVAGHLDDHWSAILGDLALTRRDDGTTTLTGPLVDQAQLHGVLAAVRDLGATLLSLSTVDPADAAADAATPQAARLAATVIVELDGNVIGDFMLRIEDAWAQTEVADQARGTQAELGWVLDPAYAGHGYATESVRCLLEYCFRALGVRRVVANCFLANDTSWRLMDRVGMRREGHAVAESLHRSGQWLDTVTYAVLAEESSD
jgi:RimJ/RimL family protein N-acetyltransferase